MKIGIFNSRLPEPGRKPGGVDVFVHRLSQRLAKRGHEVRVFSFSAAPSDALYEHRRSLRPATPTSLRRLTSIPWRLHELDTSGLEVLHLHGDDWFFLRRSLPTIRSFHGSALHEARSATRLRRQASQAMTFGLELLAARLATSSYSVGPGWRRLYRLSGTLDFGVDLSGDLTQPRSAAPSLLFVGTWHGRKRGRFLHDVFLREIKPRLPDAQLWMVSDKASPSDGVRLIRGPSDEELAELYRRSWVFCLPSTYEGFGIPYIEAMAQGTPVVASSNIGSRYVIDGSRGGLIVDDARLGQVLLRLLSDAGLRSSLGSAGHARAADFAWERVLDAHEDAYDRTIRVWTRRAGRQLRLVK